MNYFNRVLAVIVLIFLLIVAIALTINPDATLALAQDWIGALQSWLADAAAAQRTLYLAVRVIAPLVLIPLLALLLWREVRPRRRQAARMQTESGSRANVSLDSTARRLAWQIDQLADVITVSPKLTARGGSVDVVLDLETHPETDVPMKTDEVVAAARELLTGQMGLQVGKVVVNIRHAPYRDGV
jgi:hypothetical protein